MMAHERDELEPTGEDARFVERLREVYAPAPLSAAERTAFDARLRERLERSRWRGGWLPAWSAAALAALALWFAWPAARTVAPAPVAVASTASAPSAAATTNAAGRAWEQLLFESDLTRVQVGDDSAELPHDYAAIEVAFFDGV